MNQPKLLTQPSKYRAERRRPSLGITVALSPRRQAALLGLALAAIPLLMMLPAVWGNPLPPLLELGVWLLFGTVALWSGARLPALLHPERQIYRRLSEGCARLSSESLSPETQVDRLGQLLYNQLQPQRLTLWRYDAANSSLGLARVIGHLPPEATAELPFDLVEAEFSGTWLTASLPESALKSGLQQAQLSLVMVLRSGPEVVGFVGLGAPRYAAQYDQRLLPWLTLAAGQLALLLKNALLALEVDDLQHKLHRAYRRAIDIQEEERRNLATELHDDVMGRLTTMALALRRSQNNLAEKPADVGGWLANLETETQDLNRRLREITQGLHPSVLTDLGLISAMRAYIDSLAKNPRPAAGPHAISLTAQGFERARVGPQKLERDLYYITRQALDNAIKHAGAEQIFIHLRWDEQAVSVTVRDTGRGLGQPAAQLIGQNGHLGLLSMQERALVWDGTLAINSLPTEGTTVRARLPVEQPSRSASHLQAYTQYLK